MAIYLVGGSLSESIIKESGGYLYYYNGTGWIPVQRITDSLPATPKTGEVTYANTMLQVFDGVNWVSLLNGRDISLTEKAMTADLSLADITPGAHTYITDLQATITPPNPGRYLIIATGMIVYGYTPGTSALANTLYIGLEVVDDANTLTVFDKVLGVTDFDTAGSVTGYLNGMAITDLTGTVTFKPWIDCSTATTDGSTYTVSAQSWTQYLLMRIN